MGFALPLLKPKAIDVSDVPLFDFQKFFNKEEIGKGGFGAVFTVDSEEEWTSSHSALRLCFFQDGGVFLRTLCFYGVFVCHFYRVRILTRGK